MLKISDDLIKQMITLMKIHVDFNQNKKNFLIELLNKKLPLNEESKKYLDFIQKESLIYDIKYGIKTPDFSFVNLFHVNDKFKLNNYNFCFYNYQKDQVLSTNEAPPLQDLRQGKNVVHLDEDIIVPCLTYDEKPFCILPIQDIIKRKSYKKLKGKVLLYGIGIGNQYFNLLQNENITEIHIKEDNDDLKEIFKDFIFPKFNTDKKLIFVENMNEEDYDFILIADEYINKKEIQNIYKKYCNNKKVFFSNQKTIENDIKIEIFKQLVIFIGDPKNINKESEIGKNLFFYLQEKDFTLNTMQDFLIFLDQNFKDILTYKIKT